MGLLYYVDNRPQNKSASDQEVKNSSVSEDKPITQEQFSVDENNKLNKIDPAATSSEPEDKLSEEEIAKNFSQHMKALGVCIGETNTNFEDKIEPRMENVIVALNPILGETVVQYDDWNQWDFKNQEGESYRIRTEMSYEDISNPVRYLQYYKLNEQSMPELQKLDEKDYRNPSESFIDSLKAGAQIETNQKGGRFYFQNGEELVTVEKNGKIETMTLTRNNKTFTCSFLNSINSKCECM